MNGIASPDHDRPVAADVRPMDVPGRGEPAAHRVAVLADDTVVAFELAAAVHVFQNVRTASGSSRYEVGVVGPGRPVTTVALASEENSAFSLVPGYGVDWAATADTLVVPGHASFLDEVAEPITQLIRDASSRGARLVSLGIGAFALAAAGVLDGLAAATHWRWADELATRHLRITVRHAALFVGEHEVHTAAGASAVVDLVLQLVEQDQGALVAADTARQVVAPPRRGGEQVQIHRPDVPAERDPVRGAMRWAEEHLDDELTVADLARHAHLSTRHFRRRFRATIGTTPVEWLVRARVRRGQHLLEHSSWPIERIAHECGFGSPGTFRHHFFRIVGTTPGHRRRGDSEASGRDLCA